MSPEGSGYWHGFWDSRAYGRAVRFVRVVSWGIEREKEAYKQFKKVMWLILDEKF